MGGVKLVVFGSLLSMTAVQSVPWWGGIGAAHGVRAAPLALNQLPQQFGRRDTESDQVQGFSWRALVQAEDDDDDIHPRSRTLPPFSVLDEDGDKSLSLSEWKDYVHKLETKALSIIDPATDPIAKHYLVDIAKFHYDNLEACIRDELLTLESTNFTEIAAEIQHRCYIKFRYSLFAGPPPFELVSNSATTATAHEVQLWFTEQVNIARHDLADVRVFNLDERAELHLEQLVACANQKLEPWGDTEMNSHQFYEALTEITQCA
ncbi:hypothetical protein PR003_g7619 [Phytophthora rubi]|uniref:EF-hand domain-containing protein n=1 Tax=Phytophthora rubi TaxID=129364 RepID=A0A6A3MVF9_9STRA|nr:hypothetical protein PR002_g7441 [Phytophthora rubi]KAE9040652.1 hypothetical protein PR001_g6969 [Phytophthora rubi]KAE9346070.1 hypothetical protein PR003_g7619 [Phytophthora rubi]